MSNQPLTAPPDQMQRERALNPLHSVLVQAPAGSGKTDLLTRRFLRLLAEVDDPSHIVAITFTIAAAAEMRHRILSELEKAAVRHNPTDDDPFSMATLAHRALERSRALGWNIVDLPSQLRISTIDSFCRELGLQQPLLSGLGGGLEIAEDPKELYRRAARRTLEDLATSSPSLAPLRDAIETLLLWRDNNWHDLENQLVNMLCQRDRWMQDFVLDSDQEWAQLRAWLERPFTDAVSQAIAQLSALLGQNPGACTEAMELARFACEQSSRKLHNDLAELADLPCGPFTTPDELEAARQAYVCLGRFLLTTTGTFRKTVNVTHGFPPDRKREKQRLLDLIRDLDRVEGLQAQLADLERLPPARYTEEDWVIVRASFTLLRHAAAQLKVVFAEAGAVDFIEVSQLAQRVLQDPEGAPTDAALAIADEIHHLMIDEFQDTSRRQHKLVAALVAAWSDTANRSVFVVGDPMQSIYGFRDADAELFPRVQKIGLELPTGDTHEFAFAPLSSNFRTAPALVNRLNTLFESVFSPQNAGAVEFFPAQPARAATSSALPTFTLHLEFTPQPPIASSADAAAVQRKQDALQARRRTLETQTQEIVAFVQQHAPRMQQARARGEKYRIAILGRTRAALTPIAAALHDADIPFRAVDLEPLADRPEVLDVIALARALFNPEDRVAWLGVLRAPWCALSLQDLYTLSSNDDPALLRRTIPQLLEERIHLLSPEGQIAAGRVHTVLHSMELTRTLTSTTTLGTSLKQVWQHLGGDACVDPTARANLNLLWSCLDSLPGGEPDLLGRALPAALADLMAQPDPAASSDCGVQLMTIHKSKGLEFEVVLVPELQAKSSRSTDRMLTWLERGLEEPAESGHITEFLIAPLQPKGADRGKAKEWVDRVYRERERQERARILYVAATRAREELHLFARPAFNDKEGELTLCTPPDSLLATAWPALQDEVAIRFEEWKSQRPEAQAEIDGLDIAAASNLLPFPPPPRAPSPMRPALLRRLPADFQPPPLASASQSADTDASTGAASLYQRHEGGLESRALGSAIHTYLEELSRLRASHSLEVACKMLTSHAPRIAAQVRSAGLPPEHAERVATQALDLALRAAKDPVAAWILTPHPDADSETRWTGVLSNALHTVQVDRVFRAGEAPLSAGNSVWWIVDYKSAHTDASNPEKLARELRPLFARQLELYAQMLRNLHGTDIRMNAGIYYPSMIQFDWWKL